MSSAKTTSSSEAFKQKIRKMFEDAASDDGGGLSRKDFSQFVRDQNIPLHDAALDLESLYDILDSERTNNVSFNAFEPLLNPQIKTAKELGEVLEVADILKATFEAALVEPRAQRNRVNEAFLVASQKMEQEHRGFGVNFWGSRWRFRLYDDIYTMSQGPDGKAVSSTMRYAHLKTRLSAISLGKEAWLQQASAADRSIAREVAHPEGVRQFCNEWLAQLRKEELRDEDKARTDAVAADVRLQRRKAAVAALAPAGSSSPLRAGASDDLKG